KFPAYPNTEFGTVKGRIDFINHIPTDSGYMAKISLPHGLTTNFRKNITYRSGLLADAEIVTENRRLIDRLLGPLRGLSVE
ncbi:MAG: hypothetical protein J7527_15015, partial [Chitinophagaceae bacterium]|nr:hypothetical protein [Chitinophagaceae bacterium]